MKRLKLFIPLAVFVILAVLFSFAFRLNPEDRPSPLLGKMLPDFSLVTLANAEQPTSRADIIGKPFLLNVWATWCPTCKMEHPYLVELAKRGVRIVGVDYKDTPSKALGWIDNMGNPYQSVLVDNLGNLGLDLGVTGAPETFLIDSKGIVRVHRIGMMSEEVWQEQFKTLYESDSTSVQTSLNENTSTAVVTNDDK